MKASSQLLTGILMVISGIALGLYVGLWVCFIGGIVAVIDQIRSVDLSVIGVAIGVARIFFAGLFGLVSALLLVFPGFVLIDNA